MPHADICPGIPTPEDAVIPYGIFLQYVCVVLEEIKDQGPEVVLGEASQPPSFALSGAPLTGSKPDKPGAHIRPSRHDPVASQRLAFSSRGSSTVGKTKQKSATTSLPSLRTPVSTPEPTPGTHPGDHP